MASEVQFKPHQDRVVDGAPPVRRDGSCIASRLAAPATLRRAAAALIALDLSVAANQLSACIELEEPRPLPLGWQKFLHLKTGETYYLDGKPNNMSRRNGNGPKLDLKLNLSPPRPGPRAESPARSATVSPTSPPSSCVSSELNQDESSLRYSNSPEATSMVLVGCPRCLMYVMLSEDEPKCPKCKSTVLLDFLRDNANTNRTMRTRKS